MTPHFQAPSSKLRQRHPPCITHLEAAEEFGVTKMLLTARLRQFNGPKAELRFHGKTYYCAPTIRAWWARILETA